MRAAIQAFAVVSMVAMGTAGVGCASSGKGPFVRSSPNAAVAVHDGAIGSGVVLRDCAESRARWLSAFYDKKAVLIDRTTDLCLAIPEAERGAEMVRCGSEASGMVLAPLATE